MITPKTRMIALTNPNNPTGALIECALQQALVDLARRHDLWILADEVYRGTTQRGQGSTTSYTRGMRLGNQPVLITVIGEVPVNTARMVADSVTRSR